ncbi:MAG: hypothetical protein Q4C71_06030, partial [Microbacteriaceae bacterium]|nr:hypothetical protein [Microbacteriaceae bacterium]
NQPNQNFGALTWREEKQGEIFRKAAEQLLQNNPQTATPQARPERDEQGRKMSTSFRPRSERANIIYSAILILAIAAVAALFAIAKMDSTAPVQSIVAFLISGAFLALGIFVFAATRSHSRAIAWDNKHGATMIRHLAAQAQQQADKPAQKSETGKPQKLPSQHISGFGALSKAEEQHAKVKRLETLRAKGGLVPPARPLQDEHGRKMTPSYQPREEIGNVILVGSTFSVIGIGLAIGAFLVPREPEIFTMVIGGLFAAGGVLNFAAIGQCRRAIAYDNRHDATARQMPAPPSELEKMQPHKDTYSG